MQIDPNIWMLSLPVTGLLVWLSFEPQRSTVRRVWEDLTRCEAEALAWMGLTRGEEGLGYSRIHRATYLLGLAAAAGTSLLSIAAALGLVPAAV